MSSTTRIAMLFAATLVTLAACQKKEGGAGGETAQAATQPPAPTPTPAPATESPGALASRREAQESFDKARAALEKKDTATATTELKAAAAFMRTQAQEAEGNTKEALERAAQEFDSLAARVARSATVPTRTLDRAFAAANVAEARHHLARATNTLTNDSKRAGDELTMAVDHLERATKDAGRTADAKAKTAIADTKALADTLMRGAATVPTKAKSVTDQLGAEIKKLCNRISPNSKACS